MWLTVRLKRPARRRSKVVDLIERRRVRDGEIEAWDEPLEFAEARHETGLDADRHKPPTLGLRHRHARADGTTKTTGVLEGRYMR
ncbi:MAG: hypothetical protein ACK4MF_08135 [Hyphomicrobiaceae bacterium]